MEIFTLIWTCGIITAAGWSFNIFQSKPSRKFLMLVLTGMLICVLPFANETNRLAAVMNAPVKQAVAFLQTPIECLWDDRPYSLKPIAAGFVFAPFTWAACRSFRKTIAQVSRFWDACGKTTPFPTIIFLIKLSAAISIAVAAFYNSIVLADGAGEIIGVILLQIVPVVCLNLLGFWKRDRTKAYPLLDDFIRGRAGAAGVIRDVYCLPAERPSENPPYLD